MFAIVYLKSTKKIVHYRHDYSVPETLTVEDCFNQFIRDNKLTKDDHEVIEMEYDDNLQIIIGNHVFNEDTKQIEADKNYVEPVIEKVIEPVTANK